MPSPPILLSWLAINHDPFDRDPKTQTFPADPASRTYGPTLTLLFDESSEYCRKIGHVILFYQASKDHHRYDRFFAETRDAIHERSRDLPVDAITWDGEDPTDHEAVFAFLRQKIPEIRRRFPRNELVIHVSPGTPSMHTVWVLMAETGFIERPFKVVKSYRERERRGRPAVMPVEDVLAVPRPEPWPDVRFRTPRDKPWESDLETGPNMSNRTSDTSALTPPTEVGLISDETWSENEPPAPGHPM